ncbi:MAG: hypothetical protein R3253_04750 [Longimicrobiales bacterium]|nr:hypothetical protein [Longimicrobiales bacterium]
MKQWLAVTAAGFALAAAWQLPPEAAEQRDREVKSAEEIRLDALEHDSRVTAGVLFRMMWADSLSARVVSESDDGLAVLVPPRNEAVEEQRLRLANQLRQQMEPRRRTDMTFGYVIQPHDHRREDGALSTQSRTETYVGTRDGVDYCLQVRVAHADQVYGALGDRIVGADDMAAPYGDELGPCRFYLSYGLAGNGIQEWLERGAVEFAIEGGFATRDPDEPVWLRRGFLGFDYVGRGAVSEVDRCLAGSQEACRRVFVDLEDRYLLTEQQREISVRSPATGIGSRYGRYTRIRGQRHILSELEEEFGPEAFQAFWTSDGDVGTAFEAAFGIEPGAWMVRRIEELQGIDEPGPGVSKQASSASMLTIAALLGIAYWRRRERTVVE